MRSEQRSGPVIGVAGSRGSGKDTLAALLAEHVGRSRPCVVVKFAAPIKKAVAAILGCDPGQLENRAFKERPIKALGGASPRYIMQTLGTEWGRDMVSPDIWLHAARRRIELVASRSAVIISDVRFRNEAEMILNYRHGFVVRVTRPALRGSGEQHKSEDLLPSELVDVEAINQEGQQKAMYQQVAAKLEVMGCPGF